jgi:hypothetical protein
MRKTNRIRLILRPPQTPVLTIVKTTPENQAKISVFEGRGQPAKKNVCRGH